MTDGFLGDKTNTLLILQDFNLVWSHLHRMDQKIIKFTRHKILKHDAMISSHYRLLLIQTMPAQTALVAVLLLQQWLRDL